jgi:hypothetical protein
MKISPRPPDVLKATATLREIPRRVNVMSLAFKTRNAKEKKFPSWREYQTLQFLTYIALYASDLQPARESGRLDLAAQAMRNLTELCIWVEFCAVSEANAKRFHDDAARDMREMMEAIQGIYANFNKAPEARLASMIDKLKADAATKLNIQDIDAEHTLVNNAAGILGKQLAHGKMYKSASKFAHPTALLLCMKEPLTGLVDSFYEIGASGASEALRHLEGMIRKEYADF